MSKQTIWNYLKSHTSLPEVSIAGIMGNMECESNCESCRLQGDFAQDRAKSKAWANAINNGTKTIEQASQSGLGWGLCQWTYPQRVVNLINSCRSQGKGIENEEAQLSFMLAEMQMEFTNMWNRLLSCTTISDAAGLVCREYERPAVLNITARTKAGQKIYDEFHGSEPAPVPVDDKTTTAIQLLEQALALLKS